MVTTLPNDRNESWKIAGQSRLRDHEFLGMTRSLCPDCLEVVQAKIISRQGRVYFQKLCPDHGQREDFVCSDVNWFDRLEFNVPGREPLKYGVEPRYGCPYDCGLCTEHEQHTCIAVLEITDSCNLTCPMCYASSAPGRNHLSTEECQRAIDRLVDLEGQAEILQLSGGEPTVHPDFEAIFQYAYGCPIDLLMVNTNGIRIATDRRLCEFLAARSDRGHVYLQLDGLTDPINAVLRGRSLLETKLRAVERLGEYGINTTLVTTLQTDINVDQIGPIVDFGRQRSWITGVSFQPATYVGRCFQPDALSRRVTFPDVIKAVIQHASETFAESDFFPVPCAHPNSHALCYAYRTSAKELIPITRFVDIAKNYDLLANGISLTRQQASKMIEAYLRRNACGPGCDCVGEDGLYGSAGQRVAGGVGIGHLPTISANRQDDTKDFADHVQSFFEEAITQNLPASNMFRITTTSFMDAYNFDLRQLMKSCVHHLLPSGHLVPFDAYNSLYRNGHLPLPPLSPKTGRAT